MSDSSKSFAERFASKKSSTFTSQNLTSKTEDKIPESESQSNNVKHQIDPKKRMKAEQIYLVKGIDAGRKAWYYVLVERLKVKLFLKALNDDIIHLENYGSILFSAYGEEPPEDITRKLKLEYGIK